MRKFYIVLLIAAGVSVLASAVSCKTLAISGAKKYRVEITVVANEIDTEISTAGKVSDKMIAKLQKVLDKYQAEFSNYGTYRDGQEIIKLVNEGRADPAIEFSKYKEVQQKVASIRDMIRTEVPD